MEAQSYDNLPPLIAQFQAQMTVLTAEVERLGEENWQLREENRQLREENAALKAEIARLQQERKGPPAFVKASRPKPTGEKAPRKKRSMGFARKRETPTREVEHRLSDCPECGGPVSEGYEKRRRQVIELPECPLEVTDHVFYGHYCGYCGKEQVATVSPGEIGAVGEGRLGARLRSLIVVLRVEGRLPVRTIRGLLRCQYGLEVSVGEIVHILHAAAEAGEAQAEAVLEGVRAAPVVHADETGWREAGQNGYLWSFGTPEDAADPLRYYHYERSRASAVVTDVLGLAESEFGGVLVSDFYGAYNVHLGTHQRCWVHLLRDLQGLKDKRPDDPVVLAWVEQIHSVYREAKAWQPDHPNSRFEAEERRRAQRGFEERLKALAEPFLSDRSPPPHTLAQRMVKFLPELFVFVADARVPSDNNAAERSLRPSVIARKISGGTRSEKGSKTRTILMTLFATWKLQGLDLLETCRQLLLTAPTPQSQPN